MPVTRSLLQPRVVIPFLLMVVLLGLWVGIQDTIRQVCLGFYHDGEHVLRVWDTQAGVQPGDQLRYIAGRPMADHNAILDQQQGQGSLTLEIERRGLAFEVPVTLGQHAAERRRVWVHSMGIFLLMLVLLVMMVPQTQQKRWSMLALSLLSAGLFIVYLVTTPRVSPPTLRFLFWLLLVVLGLFLYLSLPRMGKRKLIRGTSLVLALIIAATTTIELGYPAVLHRYDGLVADWDPEAEEAEITDISNFGLTSAPGATAGLRVGDRIVGVNGHRLDAAYVLAHRAWLDRLRNRTAEIYQIDRNGQILEITVAKGPLPDVIRWTLISRILAVFAFLFVGALVLWRLPLDPRAQVFVGMSYGFVALVRLLDKPPLAYWADSPIVAFFDVPLKLWLLIAVANGASMLLHFFLIFPERKSWLDDHPGVLRLIYAPGLWFAVGFLLDVYQYGSATGGPLIRWIASAYFLVALLSMVRSYHTAKQRRIRKQVKFVLLSSVASTAIVIGAGFAAYNSVGQVWAGKAFIAVWGVIPVAFGYAIIKHRAMNINLIIRRSLIYTTISVLVGAGWVVLYYGVARHLLSLRQNPEMIALGMALGVGFLMPRIERSVKGIIDRTFFREDYDYQQTLREFARALASVIDLDTLLQMSVHEVCDIMHASRACILLQQESEGFQAAAWQGTQRSHVPWFETDGLFPELLRERGQPMTIEEIERRQRGAELDESELDRLLLFDAELAVPMLYQEKLRGVFLLGPKLSEDAYSPEDINLLSTLAGQAAITLENTRLYSVQLEQDRIKQELANAQRIQRAILPESDPTPKGLEVASFFQPAAEVGGDYYDYVELDEDRFALATGDVSGHGLDAGLLVSMAKSCLYTTTRTISNIESIMQIMNDMVCEVRERLFMTFAFAVMDRRHNTLTMANAGHPFPYQLRASGHLESIESGAYPLGVRRDASYNSLHRSIEPGDLLVFYSDGIIEATNDQGVQVGFDRFEDILRNAPRDTAIAYRDDILKELARFCGETPFVDDVTLIVVRYLGNGDNSPTGRRIQAQHEA